MKARCSGFSLIELMIVMGLMSIVALGTMSIAKIGLTSQRNVTAMDDARNLTGEMATLLMNPTACLNTFGGANPVASGGAGIGQVKSAAGATVYQLNTIYGNRTLKLAGITLGGAGAQPKMNLQRYAASTATQGLALAEVDWSKTGDKSGAAVLSRFFYVNATLDGANKITACNAVGGLAGEIWKRSPTDSNKIYYNEGNVGIGVTDAVSKLEVAGGVKIADDTAACDAAKEGTQRYNHTAKVMEYCDGANWVKIGGGQLNLANCRAVIGVKTVPPANGGLVSAPVESNFILSLCAANEFPGGVGYNVGTEVDGDDIFTICCTLK
jgi:prepilin-type N-terminal cleavage/methylation domain-containing protein